MLKSYTDVPVYIINMKNRLDRRNNMLDLMIKLDITNYYFIEPFEATEATLEKLKKFVKNNDINLSYSKASHTLTYLTLLANTTVNDFILFEDDVKLIKSIDETKEDLNYIVNTHPNNSDLIYLEICFDGCNYEKRIKNYTKIKNPLCAAAIYYTGLENRLKLINYVYKTKFSSYAMDVILAESSNNILNAYVYQILFVQDNNLGSDLEGSIGYKMKIKPDLPICTNKSLSPIEYNKYVFSIPTTFKYLKKTLSSKTKNILFDNLYKFLLIIIFLILLYIWVRYW